MIYKCCQHEHGCGDIYGSIGGLHVTAPSKNNDFPFLWLCQLLITPKKRMGHRKHLSDLWGNVGWLDLCKSWAGIHRYSELMNTMIMPCPEDRIFTQVLTDLRLIQFFHSPLAGCFISLGGRSVTKHPIQGYLGLFRVSHWTIIFFIAFWPLLSFLVNYQPW